MIKWLVVGIVSCVIVLTTVINFVWSVPVNSIIGASVDITPPPPPIGCTPSSTFNLVDLGSIDTFTTSTGSGSGSTFVVGPEGNNYGGVAFNVGFGTPTLQLGVMDLNAFAFNGVVTLTNGGAGPDAGNSAGIMWNLYNQRAIFISTQFIAPCASTQCLHTRQYTWSSTGPVLQQDLVHSSIASGQATTFASIADATHVYFVYTNTSGTQFILYKFTHSMVLDSSLVVGGSGAAIVSSSLIDDGTYLFFINASTKAIGRVEKATMTLTTFPIAGLPAIDGPMDYDPVEDAFYLAAGGVSIYKIARSTMTVVGSVSLGAGSSIPRGLKVDLVGRKLYMFYSNAGGWAFRRMNLTTLGTEQTISNADGGRGFWQGSYDLIHKLFWFADTDSPSHLHKVQLCT